MKKKQLMNLRNYAITMRTIIDYIKPRLNNKNIVVKVRPPLLVKEKGSLSLYIVEYDKYGLFPTDIEAFSLDGNRRLKKEITWIVKSYYGNIKLVYKDLVKVYAGLLSDTVDCLKNTKDEEVSLR